MGQVLVLLIEILTSFAAAATLPSQESSETQFEFHRGRVPATKLKIDLAAGKAVTKENRGLVLSLKINNASQDTIKTTLAHEWHGGEWPTTALYASVTPEGGKKPRPFAPVYLVGEDQTAPRELLLAAGKTTDAELRMDWAGTGSVHGVALIAKPGKYTARFALVFEVDGKRQYAESAAIEVEYKSP
jgi:hypothetical protein